MHEPPPYADYMRQPPWETGLAVCDRVADSTRDPQLLAAYLRWLTGEARQLIAELKERGIEFAGD